jgi:DNA-binding transcriptional LysR family regulator
MVTLRGTLPWLIPHVFKTQAKAEERVVFRANAAAAAIHAARLGMGVTLMPCYRGDPVPDLHRLGPPLEYLTLELWILTHPALRHTARVRVLMKHLTQAFKEQASHFDGTSVTS